MCDQEILKLHINLLSSEQVSNTAVIYKSNGMIIMIIMEHFRASVPPLLCTLNYIYPIICMLHLTYSQGPYQTQWHNCRTLSVQLDLR